MKDLDLWFTEKETDHLRVEWRIERTLFREQSQYQDVAIVESSEFGRMLVLDGIIQTSLKDEFVYHEMLAHPPLFTHPDPRKVLVIGGGDGGTVREVLKHEGVEEVHLVEIDGMVIEACRRYLPELADAFDDPRVMLHVEDGIRFVEKHVDEFDVALVDSSDPIGPAKGLFTTEFYGNVAKSLKSLGVMCVQSESPLFTQDLVSSIYDAIKTHFPWVRLYTASVPTYSVGPWSFTMASKQPDTKEEPVRIHPQMKTKYYTPEIHRAAMVLPRFVQELLTAKQGVGK